MKISIIIPVYNLKDYISQCIESLLNQDYKNYEIIIVDDGSTDGSDYILDEYAKKNNIIKVFHVKNGGAGYARNIGLTKAIGEYIMFIDGDDFLSDSGCLNKLIQYLEQKPDILMYKMISYYHKEDKYVNDYGIFDLNELNSKKCKNKIEVLNNSGQLSVSPCDKLINKSFLISNNLYFPEGHSLEDIIWSLKLYEIDPNIYFTNEEIYCYRKQRLDSISTKINGKKINDGIWLLDELVNSYMPRIKKDDMFLNFIYFTAYQYTIILSYYYETKNKEIRKKLLSYSYLLSYDSISKVRLTNRVFKLFGIKITAYFLYLYRKSKNIFGFKL